ncbi:MAG: hypothetical protein IKT78_01080 [Ruminiclostridium sp.]|nr:hypothetical protein [Ruminiclostridium sp.]
MNENEIVVNETDEQVALPVPAKSRKKMILVIIASVTALIALGIIFWFWVLAPRIAVNDFIKLLPDDLGPIATYYDKYDATLTGETIEITNGHITVDIPARFKPEEENDRVCRDSNGACANIIMPYEWGDTMNITTAFDPSKYTMIGAKIGAEQLKTGIEAIGNGNMPDSAFGTMKYLYMMGDVEHNFWNLNEQIAYAISAILKYSLAPAFCEHNSLSIYERDDACGFVGYVTFSDEQIEESRNEEGELAKYLVHIEVFDKKDLNTSTTILVNTNDLNEAYAIANSARPAK